ncbi:MAG: hypothetical protein AABN95_04065 [Acidobacteriota bacterium]
MSKSFIGDHMLAEMTEGQTVDPAFEVDRENSSAFSDQPESKPGQTPSDHSKTKRRALAPAVKQRFGLPEGFVPRWQRFERSILLEQNIYRLPSGLEFVPSQPSGTLGAGQHMYALLTTEQYLSKRRGSVYIRNDGRIFDYSVDSQIPGGDLFDTGYTIHDLERTGRYAPSPARKKKKSEPAKYRRAATAG